MKMKLEEDELELNVHPVESWDFVESILMENVRFFACQKGSELVGKGK